MRSLKSRWLFCLPLLAAFPGAQVLIRLDGTETSFWNSRSLIVGEVLSDEATEYAAQIRTRVLAVLVTDAIIPTEITIKHRIGTRGVPYAPFKPKAGDIFIMCVEGRYKEMWQLTVAELEFMETRSAVQEIDGLDDDKLTALLARIPAVRESYFRRMYGSR